MADTDTDTDTDARFYPQPPPSPLTQVAQAAPAAPPSPPKIQDRLPGGNISFHSANLGISGGPPEAPIGNVPLPTPRPPEAPQQLPPITVKPPKPPQSYVPSPVRKMEHWGDDYWAIERMKNEPGFANSQYMPAEHESPGVLRGANRQLANFSAPAIAGPAGVISGLASVIGPFIDFFSHNAFSEHYRKTALGGTQQQLAELKMKEAYFKLHEDELRSKREQMLDMQDDLRKTHYDMLTEYRGVFDDLKSGAITQETAEQEISALNQKWHHQNFDNLLSNGGIGAVSNGLDLEHQKFMHSWAASTSMRSTDKTRKEEEKQREKEDKQAELEAPYREDPGATPATRGREPGGVMGYTPPQTAEGAAPLTSPEATPATPDLTQSPVLNRAKAAGFSPNAINGLAEKMLFGDFKPADEKGNDRVVGMAKERAMEMRRQLTDIQADENLKNKQDVFNAVGAVSPRLKGQVEGLVNGAIDPPQKSNESKAPWPEIFAAARKADPNIDAYLATRKKTLAAFATGKQAAEEKVLATTYDHGDALLDKLHNMPGVFYQVMAETQGLPFIGTLGIKSILQRRGQWFPETEAAIAKLQGDILTFSGESGAVLASGVASTSGTEKERGALLKMIDWHDPASAIAAVQDRMDRLRDRQTHLAMEYVNNTGMSYKEHLTRFKYDNPEAALGITKMERDEDKRRKNAVDYRTLFPD